GMVAIKVGEKWGYLNTQGKLAIPAKYDKAGEFNSDHGVVESYSRFIIVDKKGTEIMVQEAGIIDLKEFSESLAPFRAGNKLMGFMDTQGKIAIPAQFMSVGYFHDGLAWAKQSDEMVGYINTKGEWVIKPQFREGKDFDAQSGMARVKS